MSRFGTLAIHAGSSPDPATGAVIPPISLSTTFLHGVSRFEYSRSNNPNRESLEIAIAALESGSLGICYSSGLAAIAAVVAHVKEGHIISTNDIYGGTARYFNQIAPSHNVRVSFVDLELSDIDIHIQRDTKMVWVESPSNPTMKLVNIQALANRCKELGILLVVDNTFLSPFIMQPLLLGADIVVHSATKYLNGHSDVVMGFVVVNNRDIGRALRFNQNAVGSVPSAFDCWLAHRGVKTLHLRVKSCSDNALAIATMLEQHRHVIQVNYPALPSSIYYHIAKRQHHGGLGGGMVSFRIRGGVEAAARFCRRTKIFAMAESLGGIESLIEIPAMMTHQSISREIRQSIGIFDDLIRLSCGCEDPEDLLNDLEQAFQSDEEFVSESLSP